MQKNKKRDKAALEKTSLSLMWALYSGIAGASTVNLQKFPIKTSARLGRRQGRAQPFAFFCS